MIPVRLLEDRMLVVVEVVVVEVVVVVVVVVCFFLSILWYWKLNGTRYKTSRS